MRPPAHWAVLLLLATALAGCSDGGELTPLEAQDADTDPDPTPPDPDPSDQNSTPDPVQANNTAPAASLSADVADGEAPLDVTFTIDGSDADGDDLTWSLDAGDGSEPTTGTDLPATVVVTYDVGEWTAVLTVSDGENQTQASATVTVAEPEPQDTAPTGPLQQETLSWAAGATDAGTIPDEVFCGAGPLDGNTQASLEVLPATQGQPFSATLQVEVADVTVVGWGIVYFSADCTQFEVFDADGAAPLAGTVPVFAAWADAYSYGGGSLTAVYVAG